MAERGKCRLLSLLDLLREETDPDHPLTEKQISAGLRTAGFAAERKTVLADLQALQDYGFDILNRRGKNGGYFLASRTFELSELKLLADAVGAAKFISRNRSKALLGKLYTLTSRHDAMKLDRQVYVERRVKNENKSTFYNVDTLYEAIACDSEITFTYLRWSTDKKLIPRRKEPYTVSPFALVWEDENYYLIAYDGAAERVKHFRVDKMQGVTMTGHVRCGKALFEKLDMALYTKRSFGMYGGREEVVTLRCDASLAGVVIDRFGEEVMLRRQGEGAFLVTQRVMVSPVFLGWVMGFGAAMQIVEPPSVAKALTDLARESLAQYENQP